MAGITCPSVTDCTAVGTFESLQGTRSPGAQVLVEHWDGKAWSIVPSPNPAGVPFATLFSVSCPGTSSCVAVGFDAKSADGLLHVLSERWNGKTWAVVNVPVPSSSHSTELLSVSCRSSSSCYAVGDTTTKTLIEHWNGSAWSIVASPVPAGTTRVELSGVVVPELEHLHGGGPVQRARQHLHAGGDRLLTGAAGYASSRLRACPWVAQRRSFDIARASI